MESSISCGEPFECWTSLLYESGAIMKTFLLVSTLLASLSLISEATEATNQSCVCEACVADVNALHSHLTASNNLRDEMQLRTSVCGSMPAASQNICEQAIEQIVPSLETKLRNPALVSLHINRLQPYHTYITDLEVT